MGTVVFHLKESFTVGTGELQVLQIKTFLFTLQHFFFLFVSESDYFIYKCNFYLPGGMFTYVSGANFFGEIVEWAGFAIACWSLPSLAFFLFTAFNIGPRAVQHHRYHMCIKIVVLHLFPLLVLIIFKKGILTPFVFQMYSLFMGLINNVINILWSRLSCCSFFPVFVILMPKSLCF